MRTIALGILGLWLLWPSAAAAQDKRPETQKQPPAAAPDKRPETQKQAPGAAPDKRPETQTQAPAPAQTQTPTVKVTRGAGGEKVYRITEGIVIEGKIQKPEAFYVLQRSTINYDWETLKQDFVPKILESVKHSPF